MRNTMTLRGVRTWILAAALGAACGGGDPPGGGNNGGTTDGGGMTDGTTGNGGRNPLIDVIPGIWERISIDDEPYPCDCTDAVLAGTATPANPANPCLCAGEVVVNPSDPDCSFHSSGVRRFGPPGDACIYLYTWYDGDEFYTVSVLILDGETVRAEHETSTTSGQVLDGGWRIRLTASEHRKLR